MNDEPGGRDAAPENPPDEVFVWDLAVRLFHWVLATLVLTSIVTGKTGDMEIHMLSGFSILALVIFRLVWGVVGGRHARFRDFVRGPMAVIAYVKTHLKGDIPRYRGHNPGGGWAVLAMLGLLALQAGTGLFANDDILTEGPLMKFIEKGTSDYVTWIHFLSSNALIAVVVLHVAAISFYAWKGENLVRPMLTGRKPADPEAPAHEKGGEADPRGNLIAALVILAAAAGVVWYIVNL
ncbi:MAG: cytochrome b/b6 domain-containing protein [Magnetovibrio sp.]|nr:cytochrome b/b6 domain-containing protein [Magnetovibrio sp.]